MPLSLSTPKKEIVIIGGSSWATTLVKVFTDAQNHVHWYVRDPDEAHAIRLKTGT